MPVLSSFTVRLFIFLMVVLVAGLVYVRVAAAQITEVVIEGEPVTHFSFTDKKRTDFGPLTFAGGLVFWSDHSAIGGISGLRIQDQGNRFISITDWAHWFTGEFVRDPEGRLKAVRSARIAPLLDLNGNAITSKKDGDAEGLEIVDSKALVSYEGNARIYAYDLAPSPHNSVARKFQPSIRNYKLPRNKGLEAVIALPQKNGSDHRIVVISEFALDQQGNIRGFIEEQTRWKQFSVKQKDGYQITDAVNLSEDFILILERQYSFTSGAQIRIRRLEKKDIVPGALIDGKTLLEFDSQFQIDNFEGISVWNRPDGQPMLTIISDNNFSFLQRNIILEFELKPEAFN